eukprot:92285_1
MMTKIQLCTNYHHLLFPSNEEDSFINNNANNTNYTMQQTQIIPIISNTNNGTIDSVINDNIHNKNIHNNKYKCTYCNEKLESESLFEKHNWFEHKDDKPYH